MANATENSFGVQVSKASEISQKVQPDERNFYSNWFSFTYIFSFYIAHVTEHFFDVQ